MSDTSDPVQVIVVYGALRSGTTMLRLMLDGHPEIGCPGERDFMLDHLEHDQRGFRLNKTALQDDWIFRASGLSVPKSTGGVEAFAEMCAEDAARSGKRIHVLILHRCLDQLLNTLPNIRIIHMLRDPRDVAQSSIGMGWAGNTWYGVDHWIKTEADWADQTERIATDQVFDLQYENLLGNPEGCLRALCYFLNLDYTPQMLAYSTDSTYEPVDPSLAYQWKRKQNPQEVAELDHKLGELLTASGYVPGPLPTRVPSRLRRIRLSFENKRGMWKTIIQRYGVIDPVLLRLARRLGLKKTQHAAKTPYRPQTSSSFEMTKAEKILVFGKTGQVATELAPLTPEAIFLGRDAADFADPTAIAAALKRAGDVTAIINAAAFTAVDRAEEQPELAQTVNGTSVGIIANHAAARNIPFVQISTDYVFDGSGETPRHPSDAPAPLNVYGASKLAGEEAVRAAGGPHAILRTSWVFSTHGNNFLKTMLHLSKSRTHLSIVADQIGGPTPAEAIARTCLILARALKAEPEKTGIYHFSGANDVSWADFAREIFAATEQQVEVSDILTVNYPTPATRPLNSRLNCSALEDVFEITRPDWRAATRAIVEKLI